MGGRLLRVTLPAGIFRGGFSGTAGWAGRGLVTGGGVRMMGWLMTTVGGAGLAFLPKMKQPLFASDSGSVMATSRKAEGEGNFARPFLIQKPRPGCGSGPESAGGSWL